MPAKTPLTIDLPDAQATRALGHALAMRLQRSDVLYLSGQIGAGKTEFARAIIQTLAGSEIDVPSPSFSIIQPYDLDCFDVAHVDLYRLSDSSELIELGLDDLARTHLLIVEWAERATDALPDPTISIRIDVVDDARRMVVTNGAAMLEGLEVAHV